MRVFGAGIGSEGRGSRFAPWRRCGGFGRVVGAGTFGASRAVGTVLRVGEGIAEDELSGFCAGSVGGEPLAFSCGVRNHG